MSSLLDCYVFILAGWSEYSSAVISFQPEEFSLADFQKHGVAYNEYITSDEYNYTKDGEPLYGGTVSFVEFIHSDITKADQQPEFPIGIVIAISAVFLAAIVALICVIRKKKSLSTDQ